MSTSAPAPVAFTASHWHGTCPLGFDTIRPGDVVQYDDGALVHRACWQREQPRPVCPKCFMQTALNGACGCEDQ
ncbi:hypothetical protein ACWKWN_08675 [Microbacterium trichothecenolyticum]